DVQREQEGKTQLEMLDGLCQWTDKRLALGLCQRPLAAIPADSQAFRSQASGIRDRLPGAGLRGAGSNCFARGLELALVAARGRVLFFLPSRRGAFAAAAPSAC